MKFSKRSFFSRFWEIRVVQIPFSQRIPSGCSQYYTGKDGIIQTFNFAENGRHLANQDYRACVREEIGICSISYEPCDESSFRIGPTRSASMNRPGSTGSSGYPGSMGGVNQPGGGSMGGKDSCVIICQKNSFINLYFLLDFGGSNGGTFGDDPSFANGNDPSLTDQFGSDSGGSQSDDPTFANDDQNDSQNDQNFPNMPNMPNMPQPPQLPQNSQNQPNPAADDPAAPAADDPVAADDPAADDPAADEGSGAGGFFDFPVFPSFSSFPSFFSRNMFSFRNSRSLRTSRQIYSPCTDRITLPCIVEDFIGTGFGEIPTCIPVHCGNSMCQKGISSCKVETTVKPCKFKIIKF